MPAPKYIPAYTIEDYRLWEGDWELWNGVAVAMTPSPFGRHQKPGTKIASRLLQAVENAGCHECQVVMELDWIVASDLVVRPDVAVCCESDIDEFIHVPPRLIVEVLSVSTEKKDRTAKFQLYEQQKVAWYMIVDSFSKVCEIYHLKNGRYTREHVMEQATSLPIELHPECHIQLELSNL
jgi:Uma2 family endonuclease